MEEQTSIKNIDFRYLIHHYLHLFWRWKWYLFAAPLSVALAIMVNLGLTKKPPLTATVLIGVENIPTLIYGILMISFKQGKLLLNRNFLENVARSISLQFSVSVIPVTIFLVGVVDSNAPRIIQHGY